MTTIPNGQNHFLKLKINDIEVMTQNILSFTLREWVFAQTIELDCTIMDTGMFTEYAPIYEDMPVYAEFHLSDGTFTPLNFQLSDFEVERSNSGELINVIHFTALPAIDDYFLTFRSRTFKHNISSAVVKEVMDNLSSKTDIRVESNDVQDWYQLSVDDYTFIRQLIRRSFVVIEDTPFCYMERDNTLVYTTLKTECDRKPKALLVENGYLCSPDIVVKDLIEENKMKTIYFNPSVYRKNVSSSLNKAGAYGAYVTYYNNESFINNVLNFRFSPLTTYTNTNIKHRGQFGRSDNFNTQNSAMHENYYIAVVQNDYIRTMFFSDYIQITIPADLSLRLFDKVTVQFPDSMAKQNNQVPLLDKTNSGDYIIGGITHSIIKDGTYNMILVLFRNGINEPEKTLKEIKLVKA